VLTDLGQSLRRFAMSNRRSHMSSHSSKKLFRRTAGHTHKKNMPKRIPMRGGIRL